MWPIYVSTQMDDLDAMVAPECGLMPVNYIYPDWPTKMTDAKAIDLKRFVKTVARNSPSRDHYLFDGRIDSRPNPERWQITADMPGEKAYVRRFRPNAPFFLDVEFTGRLQKESERDDAVAIIGALRDHLGLHHGSRGARISYHTLGMDFVNTFKDIPPSPIGLENLRSRMRSLNRGHDVRGRFEGRAFQDVIDYWCPFVFRTGPSDQRSRAVIEQAVKICRAMAPKLILPGWFPYVYGSGRSLTQSEIERDLHAMHNAGADGVLLLGNFHCDADGQAAGKVFTSASPEYGYVMAVADEINQS